MVAMSFNTDILQINCAHEVDRLCNFIKKQVTAMKRDGAVIGISGGVDSAVCSILCVRALDQANALGVILPEKETNPVSEEYASRHCSQIGLNTITIDITTTLEGFGTYERRDQVIKEIFPEFNNQSKSKIILPPDILVKDAFNYFTLKIMDGMGNIKTARLNNRSLQGIVAATNTKQITRMMYLNYFADLNNYLVCGTTNRTEYLQGFFVKYGDGGVDIEPILHLYKMQVYQIAEHLKIAPEIIKRPPSPDTFSFPVTDEEMYFRIPYNILDLLLYAWEHQVPISEVSNVMNLTEYQVQRVFRDLTSKYNTTKRLRLPPQSLINEVN
jgi:NAD+ synthase